MEDVLKDWVSLNEAIMDIPEDGLVELLDKEKNGQQRLSFMQRIQARINKLRSRREQAELLKGIE